MIRRDLLKSMATLAVAPALPAMATIPKLGTDPVHPQAELRKALDAYLDAYRAFFAVAPSELPEEHRARTDEERAFWQGALDRCLAWRRTRRRLATLVLEANGYHSDGPIPATIVAAAVDLGDVLVVVSGDSDYEGVENYSCMYCKSLSVVPRSPAMKVKLEALPYWPGDDVYDDTYHTPYHYRSALDREAEWIAAEDDDEAA
jgi:hypothetical protein